MEAGRKVLSWTNTNPQVEQKRFIDAYLAGRENFSSLCRGFGVSRKTGYKRLKRYQEWGFEGLGDFSRAPKSHPGKIAFEVEELVVAARMANPTWGPKKLVAWLKEREPTVAWPAPSTVGNILDRHRLTKPRRKVRRTPLWTQPFRDSRMPNQLWCADFKGQFKTGDGVPAYPFTMADAHSRYLLVCQGLNGVGGRGVRHAMERAFREYGLPEAIRTDNGPPFASVGLGGLTVLAVWWIKLGIIPERIEPGHPEQNGRLERFHRTLKADTANPPQQNLRKQQAAFDRFRAKYRQVQ